MGTIRCEASATEFNSSNNEVIENAIEYGK